mgnify:CR=1 FL=1
MTTAIKTDDVIFNFFKQICDEKDDQKCVELGNEWIKAMETNLSSMEENLNGADKLKHQDDIKSNRDHLNGLKSNMLLIEEGARSVKEGQEVEIINQ